MPTYRTYGDGKGGTAGEGGKMDGSMFLKLSSAQKHKVRLVGSPLRYFQFWEPIICRSPYLDEQNNVICPLMQMGLVPKERYASWVLDRNDGNKLKVMDFPPGLCGHFDSWFEETKTQPGGKDGPDWTIKAVSPSGKQKFTKYEAMPVGKVPFTEEELKIIRDGKLKERLLDVRKDNTPEEIRKMYADYLKKNQGEGGQSASAGSNDKASTDQQDKGDHAPSTQASGDGKGKPQGGSDGFDEMEF